MLTPLQRGLFTPLTEVVDYVKTLGMPRKVWRRLDRISQIRRLKHIAHDVMIDVVPRGRVALLVFFKYNDCETTVFIENYSSSMTVAHKLDLGPISSHIFKGTVLEVKYWENTFHVYDVLYWKGDKVTERDKSFKNLEEEVLPFLSRPRLYSYDDISQLTEERLLFLPKTDCEVQQVWIYCPSKGHNSTAI